jgi:GNAT superfamily N-acetyltransferase
MQIPITPSLQRQGLGTQLIQSIITEARDAGASLKLKVLKTNPARRLYERL